MRPSLLLVPILLAACAGPSRDGEGHAAKGELIGGSPAAAGQFPSTLYLYGTCTAAKVGRRHILTAAHCIDDDTGFGVAEAFGPGRAVLVTNSVDGGAARDLRITRTLVHPSHRPKDRAGLAAVAVSDVAVIEIDEESTSRFDDIASATIDLAAVAEDEPVTIMGFGCEQPGGIGRHRLKFQPTHVASQALGAHEPTRVASELPSNFFTPGLLYGGQAMGCPGDSGGPVYRGDGATRLVVGVNSHLPRRDIGTEHARLDVESRFDIGSWLGSIPGVQVHGEISDHFVDCSDEAMLVCGAIAKARTDAGDETFGAPWSLPQWATRHDGAVVWRQDFEKGRISVDRATGAVAMMSRAAAKCEDNASATFCGAEPGDQHSLYTCRDHVVASRVECPTKCGLVPDGQGSFSVGCEPAAP